MSRPFARTRSVTRRGSRACPRPRAILGLEMEIPPAVVDERHGMAGHRSRHRIDPSDEQVVVAGGERLDDRALQGRDRAVEQRQTGGPRTPGRPAERLTRRLDGRTREAVGQLILVLAQDVDRVAAARANGGRDEPSSIERDHHERRLQRHGRQGVHGDALRSVAVERRHHGHARGEMAHDASELVGEDVHPRRIRTNGQAPREPAVGGTCG